jgi:hypothetical protein
MLRQGPFAIVRLDKQKPGQFLWKVGKIHFPAASDV